MVTIDVRVQPFDGDGKPLGKVCTIQWSALVQIVAPHYPKAKTVRPPFGIETMLRIPLLQQWFGLSDPAM